jgi:hypothetical protein
LPLRKDRPMPQRSEASLPCSKNAHYPNSWHRTDVETHGQTAPEAGHAKRCKSNSYCHGINPRK